MGLLFLFLVRKGIIEMNKSNVTKMFKDAKTFASKHSPEILTGLGIAGMVTTTVLAVKATPKAMRLLEEKKQEEHKHELTPVETVKTAWKPYVPAAVMGTVSIGCLVGSTHVSVRRNAALAAAYQLSTTTLNEFKEKMIETVGEETAKEVREKIVQEKKEKVSKESPTIIIASDDDILMYEPISNQEFKSTTNKVEKAAIELNRRLTTGSEFSVSLNEFLHELELRDSSIGNDIGWSADKLIDIMFDVETNDHGKPRLRIVYLTPPEHGYNNYY